MSHYGFLFESSDCGLFAVFLDTRYGSYFLSHCNYLLDRRRLRAECGLWYSALLLFSAVEPMPSSFLVKKRVRVGLVRQRNSNCWLNELKYEIDISSSFFLPC